MRWGISETLIRSSRTLQNLKSKAKSDPLVKRINLNVVLVSLGSIHPWRDHLFSRFFTQRIGNRVSQMNPAISIQYFLWNVFNVNAIDCISDQLSRPKDNRKHYQNCCRRPVVKFKNSRISFVNRTDKQIVQPVDENKHFGDSDLPSSFYSIFFSPSTD